MPLLKYLHPYRRELFFVILLLLGQSLTELFLPTLMAGIINNGIVYAAETGTPRTGFILLTGAKMLLFALLAGAFSMVVAYLSPRIAAGAARDLRRDLFVKVESFSQAEFDKFSSASLITRCTNDITQIQNVANIFPRMLLYAPVLAIGGIIMALHRAPSLSWILWLSLVILIGFVILLVSIVMPKFAQMQGKTDNMNKVSREILHGLPVIRAFGAEAHEEARFAKSNADLRNIGLFIAKTMAFINPLIIMIMGFTQVAIIWFGAAQVSAANVNIGDMMAFFQYTMQVLFAFMMISMVLVMVPRAQISAKRVQEVFATPLTICDPVSPQEFAEDERGAVKFENVSFKYPGAEMCAVENISFTALPGQTTAIIGATGAGKSTVVQLLLRFYDVNDGKISVSGADIRTVRQADLRKKIGYVPQKSRLLSGTIASNIMYAERNTADTMKNAAEIAQATDFINEKDGGFEAEISQSGANVSGGQRQRLSIARALAKRPEILVFDDSFSALDTQTDANLRTALDKNLPPDTTIIMVSQRISTIINADQILVMDEGKITGCGTHTQLMKTCPHYIEIAKSQDTKISE